MKRTIYRLSIAALTFAAGLMLTVLPHAMPKLMAIFSEPGVEAPTMISLERATEEVYPEAKTTDDFDQFWSEFKSAVKRDDKQILYRLMHCNEFYWQLSRLKLRHKLSAENLNYHYAIRSYDEFDRHYSEIFCDLVKRAILNRQPWRSFVKEDEYYIPLAEGSERNEFLILIFYKVEGKGYKFNGVGTLKFSSL